MSGEFTPAPLSLYIHIPFCRSRCSYCAFNTYAGLDEHIPAYINALSHEIEWLGRRTGSPRLHTVYLGGGTPSILSADQVGTILTSTAKAFLVGSGAEISLECNPSGIENGYFETIRACGVNRLSIGAQAANAATLKMFGRTHNWTGVVSTIRMAQEAGFENISLDLIYGAPDQTLQEWDETLQKAAACMPTHMSLYALSLEPGTALFRRIEHGYLPEVDADLTADLYEHASEYLSRAGYRQYEISNWAKPGYECEHNLQYWRRVGGYLAVGAGAYGYLDHVRYGAVDSIAAYIEHIQRGIAADEHPPHALSLAEDPDKSETLNEHSARTEAMILGLRMLQEGVDRRVFAQRFGSPPETYYPAELQGLLRRNMITADSARIMLRPHARLISNQVMVEFA